MILWIAYYFRQGQKGAKQQSLSQAAADRILPKVDKAVDKVLDKTPKPVRVVFGIVFSALKLVFILACFVIGLWVFLRGQPVL
jgi:hypothetical protein